MTMNGWWLGEIVHMYVCQTDRQGYPFLYKPANICTLLYGQTPRYSKSTTGCEDIKQTTHNITNQFTGILSRHYREIFTPFYSERGNARSSVRCGTLDIRLLEVVGVLSWWAINRWVATLDEQRDTSISALSISPKSDGFSLSWMFI